MGAAVRHTHAALARGRACRRSLSAGPAQAALSAAGAKALQPAATFRRLTGFTEESQVRAMRPPMTRMVAYMAPGRPHAVGSGPRALHAGASASGAVAVAPPTQGNSPGKLSLPSTKPACLWLQAWRTEAAQPARWPLAPKGLERGWTARICAAQDCRTCRFGLGRWTPPPTPRALLVHSERRRHRRCRGCPPPLAACPGSTRWPPRPRGAARSPFGPPARRAWPAP